MRIPTPEREDLKNQLKAERKRFDELDKQKNELWIANTLQGFQRVKRQWQDSAEQINHLHRMLYPNFPYSGTCPNCGSDTLPVLGTNPVSLDQCVACKQPMMRL